MARSYNVKTLTEFLRLLKPLRKEFSVETAGYIRQESFACGGGDYSRCPIEAVAARRLGTTLGFEDDAKALRMPEALMNLIVGAADGYRTPGKVGTLRRKTYLARRRMIQTLGLPLTEVSGDLEA